MSTIRIVAQGTALALGLVLAMAAPEAALADRISFSGTAPEEALGGLDAVELAAGQSVEGKGRYTYVHGGLQWRFANEENKQRFKANPEQFKPN